jgi:hypothetical protein
MLSHVSTQLARTSAARFAPASIRSLTTVKEAAVSIGSTADDALKYSGYTEIDFTIKESAFVYEAVQKFAAFNIGCLVTTDAAGKLFHSSRCCVCVFPARHRHVIAAA